MRQFKIVSIFVVILILATSCAQSSTDSSPSGESTSVNTSAEAEAAPSNAQIAFYQQQSKDENSPKFRLWVEPVDDDPMPPILVECMGKESEVYSPKTGLLLNNHCIIKTRDQIANVVLGDGSLISLNTNTVIQFNLSDNAKEIIIKEGEAYFDVADQQGATFKVSFGDSTLEVVGTEFDVNIQDTVMSVFMATGSVAHYICSLWENNACSEWGEVFENLFGTNMYTRTVGAMEWQKTEYSEEYQTGESPDSDFIFNARVLSDFYNGAVASGLSAYQQAGILMGNLTGSTSHFDIPDEEYNQMANERNEQTASLFCEYYPENCFAPTAMPTMSVPVVSQPSMSSGGSGSSSGGAIAPSNFPNDFTQSKCSTQYGHYYCTSNEAGKAGTWDLTEICKAYPGTSYCSWPEVQNTLR